MSKKAGYTLTISVGNSNTIIAVFAGEKYIGKWRLETRVGRTADEYGTWLRGVFEHSKIEPQFINGIVICSVVPKIDMVLTSMCRRFFKLEPLYVLPGVKTGVQINYGRAGDLGPDRLANIVALAEHKKFPSIVIDFGTTTSFDVIDAKGNYTGGTITPGVNLALSSLSSAAPQLPEVGLTKPDNVIGRNIVKSMQSGCYWGTVDMVQGLMNRIWKEIGVESGYVVATGGFAKELENSGMLDEVDTNLTLKGLKLIYDRTTS